MVYAIVDNTGLVVNVVEWTGNNPWQPAPGQTAVPLTTDGGIGWSYIDGEFVPPVEPAPQE